MCYVCCASEFTYVYVATLHILLENLFMNAIVILCYTYIIYDFCFSMYTYTYLGKQHFLSYFTEGDI